MRYDELTEEAKESAIDSMSDINVDHEWWDDTIEDIRHEWVEKYGIDFKPEGVYFDLYPPRRVMYFGRDSIWVDNQRRLLAAISPSIALEMALEQSEMGHILYFHTAPTGRINGETHLIVDDYDNAEDRIAPLALTDELVDDWFKDICGDFRRRLESEWEYLTSREAVEETIIANEYEFDVEGSRL